MNRLLCSILVSLSGVCFAQTDSTDKVDANFIFNYYEQDGNHSAVTGGRGTQELQDIAGKLVVKVEMDSVNTLFTSLSINKYSSASTDRIDSRLSSASARDYHMELGIGFEKKKNDKLSTGGSFYGAVESDYVSLGLGYSLKRKDVKRGTYTLKIKGFYDSWILVYPEEIRREYFRMAPTDKRYSINFAQGYSWNVSKKMKAKLSLDLTWQHGMLATPFHRVYFLDTVAVGIEQLPENRLKIPVGLETNTYLSDLVILKTKVRLYADNFGVNAFTGNISPVLLVSKSMSLAPFYRYHVQSGSKYFNTFAKNVFNDSYYTSDYDLSGFSSNSFGVTLKYNPVYGVLGKNRMGWKNIGIRYSNYSRSDGLAANIIGLNCGFVW